MTQVLILGAGLAGSAVAWHLARRGGNARILERESQPGTHATSQNAAMVRALVYEEHLLPFAFEGTRFWTALPAELARSGAFRQVGSLLLASEASTLDLLRRRVEQARRAGLRAELWTPRQCRELLPVLAATPLLGAAHCEDDGVADPVGLVQALLEGARHRQVELELAVEVEELLVEDGCVRGLRLVDGTVREAATVVLAAGAWTPGLLRRAGVDDRGLRAHRRHLVFSGHTESTPSCIARDAPFVWHLDLHAYFRWEGGGVLFSACDEEMVPAGRPAVAPEIDDFLGRRLPAVFPFLLDLPLVNRWAGLRTFTPDHAFLLGRDPAVRGLVHASGLGGHGVTCAAGVGRVVADAILTGGERSARGGASHLPTAQDSSGRI